LIGERSRENEQILLNGLKKLAFEWKTRSAACSPLFQKRNPDQIATALNPTGKLPSGCRKAGIGPHGRCVQCIARPTNPKNEDQVDFPPFVEALQQWRVD
jgi:hypothetical protein